MPYDFPDTPTTGQTVTMPDGSTRQWDGVKWHAGAGTTSYLPANLVANEVVFGAASGGGAAQDAQLLWDPTYKNLGVGTNPKIHLWGDPNHYGDILVNASASPGWAFDDTTHDAFLFSMDQVNHVFNFQYAPASANPPAWSKLATLAGVSPGQQLLVGQGAGTIGVLAWPSTPQSVLSGNITISGGAYTEVDATKSAFLFVMAPTPAGPDNFSFLRAPAGNPPTWTTLAQLDNLGRWSTVGLHRFRYLVSYAKLVRNTVATLTADAAAHVIPWDLLLTDTDSIWNGSAFVAPVAGYYHVILAVVLQSIGGWFNAQIIAAGSQASITNYSSTSLFYGQTVWMGHLNTGDQVVGQYVAQSGVAAPVVQAGNTWMTICYLGE
jgi:hypothetical protein